MWMPGTWVTKRWCEQEVLDLARVRAVAAATEEEGGGGYTEVEAEVVAGN